LNTTYEVDGLTLETSDKGTSGFKGVFTSKTHTHAKGSKVYAAMYYRKEWPNWLLDADPTPGDNMGFTVGCCTTAVEAAKRVAIAKLDPAWALANKGWKIVDSAVRATKIVAA